MMGEKQTPQSATGVMKQFLQSY